MQEKAVAPFRLPPQVTPPRNAGRDNGFGGFDPGAIFEARRHWRRLLSVERPPSGTFAGSGLAPRKSLKQKEMNRTMSDKVRLHLRLTPETYQLIGEYAKKDNCTTLNEFVENAVEFYAGYLSAEDCLRFLPPSLATAVRGTIQDTENHICRLLFKLAVELDMMMNVLASELDTDPETLERMRGRCIQEVKKTIGCITFADAVKYQRGE